MKSTLTTYLISLLIGIAPILSLAENGDPQKLQAIRISDEPKIDGKLDDICWQKQVTSDRRYFTQRSPANLERSRFETEVYFAYSDRAIFIAARLYDDNPDSIQTELGLRDNTDTNTDLFGVGLDPYLNRQNAFVFVVTAAGVQADAYETPNNWDQNWNQVWRSKVRIHEEGWDVEIEIPYSSLRFPKKDIQTWGLNFYRNIRRYREESFWDPVDANINGSVNQYGTLHGIKGIDPPLRLSLIPYVSGYMNQQSDGSFVPAFNGGMDLKYGINEAFTLDVSLIPDFGQVRSDNLVLNLGPFEVRFDENRPFFTEGTELFNKGGLFYSRRIGGTSEIVGEVRDDEEIISRPQTAPLINATKLSGRTKTGTGIGLFNAVTNESFLRTTRDSITQNGDTIQVERDVLADPLTNFNVFVIDQNLKNNSNITLVNTNVSKANNGRNANVTGAFTSFFDKTNTWNLRANFVSSNIWSQNSESGQREYTPGYAYFIRFGKVSGAWQFGAMRNVESATYQINDLGFLRAPNEVAHSANVSWRKNEPFSIFNRLNINTNANHTMTHTPREYDNFNVNFNVNATFKNFMFLWVGTGVNPMVNVDHFDARTDGYVFRKPWSRRLNFWYESDSRKKFYMGVGGGVWQRPDWKSLDRWIEFNPRFRFNDKFTLSHSAEFMRRNNEYGFATRTYTEEGNISEVIVGDRNIQTITQTFRGKYTINALMGITLRIRHYWSQVNYNQFFSLSEDGYLSETEFTQLDDEGSPTLDANFNAFSVDAVYTWQFAPASTLTLVWKNNINTFDNNSNVNMWENYNNLFENGRGNSISIRVLYFLDYQEVKRTFSK
ncbi:MAG: carbohydrate binding family 9 domain-containing protein [Bacteroidia bacterium]|nr:carbohydrate binding family 9 domain-containing protein [Bacteroidia bacterium]